MDISNTLKKNHSTHKLKQTYHYLLVLDLCKISITQLSLMKMFRIIRTFICFQWLNPESDLLHLFNPLMYTIILFSPDALKCCRNLLNVMDFYSFSPDKI